MVLITILTHSFKKKITGSYFSSSDKVAWRNPRELGALKYKHTYGLHISHKENVFTSH